MPTRLKLGETEHKSVEQNVGPRCSDDALRVLAGATQEIVFSGEHVPRDHFAAEEVSRHIVETQCFETLPEVAIDILRFFLLGAGLPLVVLRAQSLGPRLVAIDETWVPGRRRRFRRAFLRYPARLRRGNDGHSSRSGVRSCRRQWKGC